MQSSDIVPTVDQGNTSYLYISMPKRGCKKVSDVRTDIANPNRQVCFEDVHCNSCKILFAHRAELLSYDNRFDLTPMQIMTKTETDSNLASHKRQEEEEQQQQQQTSDDDGQNNNFLSKHKKQQQQQEESMENDRQNSIFKEQKHSSEPRRKNPAVLTSESECSDGEGAQVDDMFYNPNSTRYSEGHKKKSSYSRKVIQHSKFSSNGKHVRKPIEPRRKHGHHARQSSSSTTTRISGRELSGGQYKQRPVGDSRKLRQYALDHRQMYKQKHRDKKQQRRKNNASKEQYQYSATTNDNISSNANNSNNNNKSAFLNDKANNDGCAGSYYYSY